MMKVLHLETGRHLYGGARQVLYLLQGLWEYPNCRNELVCPKGSEIMTGCRDVADRVHPLAMHGELDPVFFFRLTALLRSTRPDLVHVHSRRGADIWGGLAARICGIPAVVSRRVDNPESRLTIKSKYGLYRRIIAISRGIEQVLVSEGVDRSKMVCVPDAVNASLYQHKADRGWFRNEFGIPADAQVIGTVAQLIERKGHWYLLKAIPEILDNCPKTRFLLFGRGPLHATLLKRVREMGLDRVVHFCGFRSDLPKILPCLQLVVHPALMEGLGVSLLQAAAAGIPLVATRTGGIPEAVRDGRNGILVEPRDPAALAAAVLRLLKDPVLGRDLGRAGRSLVREQFSVDSMVAGNYRVYADLLQSPGV